MKLLMFSRQTLEVHPATPKEVTTETDSYPQRVRPCHNAAAVSGTAVAGGPVPDVVPS
jgi:hypothetical protein